MTNKIYQDVEVRGKASATGQISGASLNVTGEINGANLSVALLATLRDYFLPVGSRVKQRQGEQTPAAKFGGTWVVDTDYTGRSEIGSGTDFTLGATGGSADAVVVQHRHSVSFWSGVGGISWDGRSVQRGYEGDNRGGDFNITQNGEVNGPDGYLINLEGESGTGKNMPPYKVVTVWKRTA